MKKYDAGSAITVEVEFNKQDAYTGKVAFDPDANTHTITVTDPDGAVKVNAQVLTKSTTGNYYYKIQTTTAWVVGIYEIQIDADSGAYSDVTVDQEAFELV